MVGENRARGGDFELFKHYLGAIHKCQHLYECTNHTLLGEGGGSVQINIFSVHFLARFFIIFMGFLVLKKC